MKTSGQEFGKQLQKRICSTYYRLIISTRLQGKDFLTTKSRYFDDVNKSTLSD